MRRSYFGPPLARAERGRAVIAGPRVDAIEQTISAPCPRKLYLLILRSAKRISKDEARLVASWFETVLRTSFTMRVANLPPHDPEHEHGEADRGELQPTRHRISFCDVLGEPPRIMLTRPISSTSATAPIATVG